jgi:hypothetical protein
LEYTQEYWPMKRESIQYGKLRKIMNFLINYIFYLTVIKNKKNEKYKWKINVIWLMWE